MYEDLVSALREMYMYVHISDGYQRQLESGDIIKKTHLPSFSSALDSRKESSLIY